MLNETSIPVFIQHSTLNIQHFAFQTLSPPSGGVAVAAASRTLLISSFSSFPGLKYGIFFDGTSTFSPVFGLRPVRDFRLRRRKLPKPRSSIFWPERRESTMESKT